MSARKAAWPLWRLLGMALTLVLVAVSVPVARGRTLPGPVPVEQINASYLEPGDLLFVDIYHGWSQAGYWDHIAVYVGGPYPSVVEATYNAGVTLTGLEAFLARDLPAEVSVRRLRATAGRQEAMDAAVQYALDQVGRAFDYTATATLPLKINAGNLHCAEVAWRAYLAGGLDLDSNGGLLVYPDDIYFSPELAAP